ncbi:uncharacterized protein [Venturia canescens]|uniref:uncharacterized protein isoform X4 n=1 Tax=Venturia canescens TaxID=32260 RepID=UPI001C9C02C8|nr:uncharacterized protein LOC122407544 isoform X4 [Venturia canescens]
MLEITTDEFLEKAAALKGNIEILIAEEQNEQEVDEIDELQEPPPIRPSDPDFEQDIFAEEPPQWLLDNAVEQNDNDPERVDLEEEAREALLPRDIENEPIVIEDSDDDHINEHSSLDANENKPQERTNNGLVEETGGAPLPTDIENEPIVIEDSDDGDMNEHSLLDANENEPQERANDGGFMEETREVPQSRDIAVDPTRRRRSSEMSEQLLAGPSTEPIKKKKQKRNKRRKEMRKKAVARLYGGSMEESIPMQEEQPQ